MKSKFLFFFNTSFRDFLYEIDHPELIETDKYEPQREPMWQQLLLFQCVCRTLQIPGDVQLCSYTSAIRKKRSID